MSSTNDKLEWWKKTVVYQVYPRSFYDSNGDGIGDLWGIIEKLDYLKDLGVETIWFSPFTKSPQMDFGYDVSHFTEIDPFYGDMKTCDKLIEEVHKGGMKIVLDLVLNHTSDQHPWFIESRSSLDNLKRDWYIWRDGRGKKPPNNWMAQIGGSGWHYDKKTDQWYWAQFLPFQPDLNYRNPEVKKTMFDVVRFWLKKKADGFRLDIINAVYEDSQFRNNPWSLKWLPSDTDTSRFFRKSLYTLDHPDTLEFVKELRVVIDEFDDPPRFLVGEVFSDMETMKKYCGEKADGLNTVFLFKSIRTSHDAKKFKKLIKTYEKYFQEPYIPTWVFANHDRMRRITRLKNNLEKAKLHAAFQLTVRGVPYIYYGEEIGMESPRLKIRDSLDEMGLKYNWIPQVVLDLIRVIGNESFNRDEQRTPMQWNSKEHAGFCPENVKPWLPIPRSYLERNVYTQLNDPGSLLNCYKRFLEARKDTPALNSGDIQIMNLENVSKNVLSYIRSIKIDSRLQKAFVFLNFGDKKVSMENPIKTGELLVSTHINTNTLNGDIIVLQGQQGIVIVEKT
jgi:oligo-1,6-glucosidase/alpha-glucosidase